MRRAVRPLALALGALLALAAGSPSAQMMSNRERDELIQRVLKSFWGRAKVSKDKFAQPSSPEERKEVPVSKPVAYRTIDAGEVSGLAEWCGADWESHFLAFAKAAREKGLNDTQIAFVSVLHGAAQGSVVSALRKGRACNEADRAKVERYLREFSEAGL